MTVTNELTEVITQLCSKAKSGEVSWQRVNPSTFKLVQDDKGEYLTLQQVYSTNLRDALMGTSKFNYILQFISHDPQNPSKEEAKKVLVTLSSADRSEYTELLRELYSAVNSGIDKHAANMLGRFLK